MMLAVGDEHDTGLMDPRGLWEVTWNPEISLSFLEGTHNVKVGSGTRRSKGPQQSETLKLDVRSQGYGHTWLVLSWNLRSIEGISLSLMNIRTRTGRNELQKLAQIKGRRGVRNCSPQQPESHINLPSTWIHLERDMGMGSHRGKFPKLCISSIIKRYWIFWMDCYMGRTWLLLAS